MFLVIIYIFQWTYDILYLIVSLHRNFLHSVADCENDEAEVDEGYYGLWLLTVSSTVHRIDQYAFNYRRLLIFDLDHEERLMHLHQLADCLLLFKRTMGSIEALKEEDVNLLYFIRIFVIDFSLFYFLLSGGITNGRTKDEQWNQYVSRRNIIK